MSRLKKIKLTDDNTLGLYRHADASTIKISKVKFRTQQIVRLLA